MGEGLRCRAGAALVWLAMSASNSAAAADPDAAPTAPVDDEGGGVPAISEWSPWRECASPASTLTIESSGYAMHENDTTQGQVRLLTKDGKTFGGYLGGTVGCLAYSRSTGKYVLGQVGGLGAWRPLLSILYVSETTGKLTASRAPPASTEYDEWYALAAVASDDGRFVALVSGFGGRIGLTVLDTKRDCMLRIGRPPLPPPSTWAEWNVGKPSDFAWGEADAGTDGFVGMDPGILTWRGRVLEVSYGKDGPTKRANQRRKKRWDMDGLAGKCSVGRPARQQSSEPELHFGTQPAPPPTDRQEPLDIFSPDFGRKPSP
jgi:hypothetical protein